MPVRPRGVLAEPASSGWRRGAPALREPFPSDPEPSARSLGWYHPPVGPSRAAGVVLCNPIGDDDVRAHRPLRHLALDLAAAGFAGASGSTSAGRAIRRAPSAIPGGRKQLEDVRLAADELRARSGAGEIALVGLRLGGTVATAAAAGARADSLVVWNAYPSGETFVRESTKLHRMQTLLDPQGFAAVPEGWKSGGEEALGFLLAPETIAGLKEIDLFALKGRPVKRALVVGTSNVPTEDKLLAKLQGLGTDAEYHHLPAHKFLVQSPHRAEVPALALGEIVSWLSAQHLPLASSARAPPPPPPPPARSRASQRLQQLQRLLSSRSSSGAITRSSGSSFIRRTIGSRGRSDRRS